MNIFDYFRKQGKNNVIKKHGAAPENDISREQLDASELARKRIF